MSKTTICRQCKTCGQSRPFSKQRVSHILHAFLSLITGGLWVFIWIMLGVLNVFTPFRCEFCGKGKL